MANTKISGCGFHHLALRVRDFDRSYAFYTQVLGFAERVAWGEGDGRAALLDLGDGGCLELFAGRTNEEAVGIFWHVALRVDDVDATYALAMEAGCEDYRTPRDAMLGDGEVKVAARLAFVRGFDGELIEFFCEK